MKLCAYCKKEPIKQNNIPHTRYCSDKCARANWAKTHREKYPDRVSGYRKILIELLGNKCKTCDSVVRLELDHIVPVKDGGENTFSNLQVLCSVCHRKKTLKRG